MPSENAAVLTPDPSDAQLIDRVRRGDAAAFDSLVRTYAAALCAFARHYVHAQDVAEELVQDLFCRLWERRQILHIQRNVRTYLYAAVRNLALAQLRHARVERRAFVDAEDPDITRTVPDAQARRPDEEAELDELRHGIEHAIAQLPERCRLVYLLRWKHHLSYTEIAAVMDISVKAVEMHHARGAKVLRPFLTRFLP